jgi:hypothetical protein
MTKDQFCPAMRKTNELILPHVCDFAQNDRIFNPSVFFAIFCG